MLTGTRTLPGFTPTFSGVRSPAWERLNLSSSAWDWDLLFVTFSEVSKTAKKMIVKAAPEMVATCFVNRLMKHRAKRVRVISATPKGISTLADFQIEGYPELPLARLLESQHQHRQPLHGETPHHAECVSLAQQENVAAAQDDRENLQPHDQVQDAIGRAEAADADCRNQSGRIPSSETRFKHPVRADDSGVHRSGQHQNTHHHYEDSE